MATSEPISSKILDEAAAWLVQLNASDVTDSDRNACAQWQALSPEHARAWVRAEILMQKFQHVPPQLAMSTLGRNRRKAINQLALLLTAPAAWYAWQASPWREWVADHRTRTGQQSTFALPDGGTLTLNTQTAVNVRYTTQIREIVLIDGEIMIETARDNVPTARPFIVSTKQGTVRALGTRFSVRTLNEKTHTAVLQDAIEITPTVQGSKKQILRAGEQTQFTGTEILSPYPADGSSNAWLKGMLVADRLSLGDFIEELSRYRPGLLRCDPNVAALPVSGAYPVLDTERTLSMLQRTYPIHIQAKSRYWINITAK